MDKKEGDQSGVSSKNKEKGTNSKIPNAKLEAIAKNALLESIVKKIEYYMTKNTITDLDLYYLIKEFFREFLDLKYEFSLDELIHELDKIYLENSQRDNIVIFINKVKAIEYHDSPFNEPELKSFVKEFAEIAQTLTKMSNHSKESFWQKTKKLFAKKTPAVYQEPETANTSNAVLRSASLASNTVANNSSKKSNELKDEAPAYTESLPEIPDADNLGLEKTTEDAFVSSETKLNDIHDEDLNKYKSDTSVKSAYKSSNKASSLNTPNDSVLPDLASIEEHNKMILGQSEITSLNQDSYNEISNESMPATLSEKKTKKEKKVKPSKSSDKSAGDKSNKASLSGNANQTTSKKSNYSWSDETEITPEVMQSIKSKSKNDSKSNSKLIVNKETKKDNKKEGEKTTQKTEDIDSLIAKAKKVSKKSELINLYKKIYAEYDKEDVQLKSKYYKDVMTIYKRMAKLK